MRSADAIARHATIKVGDSPLMVSSGTELYGKTPSMLHLYVPDVDALYARALEAGGISLSEPTDEFYGDRRAGIEDAWKNQWWIATHVEDVELGEASGSSASSVVSSETGWPRLPEADFFSGRPGKHLI